MKNKEDIKFLQSMKTDCISSISSFDKKLALQLQHKDTRIQKQEERRRKFNESATASTSAELSSNEESCAERTINIDSPFKQPDKDQTRLTRTH